MIPELREQSFVIVSALILSSTVREAGEGKFNFGSCEKLPGATRGTPQMF